MIDTNHIDDYENAKIIDKERLERKRVTLESLRIQQRIQNTMNSKEDISNINFSYSITI